MENYESSIVRDDEIEMLSKKVKSMPLQARGALRFPGS